MSSQGLSSQRVWHSTCAIQHKYDIMQLLPCIYIAGTINQLHISIRASMVACMITSSRSTNCYECHYMYQEAGTCCRVHLTLTVITIFKCTISRSTQLKQNASDSTLLQKCFTSKLMELLSSTSGLLSNLFTTIPCNKHYQTINRNDQCESRQDNFHYISCNQVAVGCQLEYSMP